MHKLFWIFLLLFLPLWATPEELTVHLQNPEYQGGVLSTDEGGIISSPELWLQARHIVYTNKIDNGKPVHTVIAEKDLMLDSGGNTYVGRRLEYDFITKTGIVYEGCTAIDLWFLGGENIRLNSDKSIYLYNAFATTSESKKGDWKIQTKEAKITHEKLLSANHVTFRFLNTPILWLPSFKTNLKTFGESPIKYEVRWDTGPWPKLGMRYRVYSSENANLYCRLNLRHLEEVTGKDKKKHGVGVGGAIETNYKSLDTRKNFRTQSYLDSDVFYRDTNPKKKRTHYRLRGSYEGRSDNQKAEFLATYDWLSDKNMQADFGSKNFELDTVEQTKISLRNYQDWMIFGIDGKFRVNGFQGMKQELPQLFWTPKSFELGKSGIISENRLKGAYLDYVSAKTIEVDVPDFSAVRLSTHHALYRPFHLHGLSLTPTLGIDGIFYGDSRKNHSASLAVLTYQLLADLTLKRQYSSLRHVLKPYIHYQGALPTIASDTPYIFSIQDGFHRLNLIKSGIRHLFYFKKTPLFDPNMVIDLYAYSFLGNHTFKKTTPKLQGNFIWNFPSWSLTNRMGWNIEKRTLDYANIGLAWTINENFAFKSEFRHRGRFSWRRGDPDNFIMEVTRNISDLVDSPLSDGRNVLLNRLQVKLAPQWIARLESQIGWGRKGKQTGYHQAKLELITIISTSWRLSMAFTHSPTPNNENNTRFTFGLSLIPKP